MKNTSRELEELRREVAYYRRMTEETIAKTLQFDIETISIRHELEQKRRGFSLMADLTASQGKHADPTSLFVSISRRINAALGMQRTAVLQPGPGGIFRPSVLQGYSADEEEAIANRQLFLPPEFLDPHIPVLITGADDASRFAELRRALELPFLISSPVFLQDEVAAVLITGRMLEQYPYMPPLGKSEVETVQTVGTHLASLLSGHLLVEAEQRMQVMLDAMPFCCNLWDEDHNNIDCNEAAARLFELSSKEEYLDKFFQLSPEYQPGGRCSVEVAREKVNEAFSEGYSRFEWLHQKLDGDPIPAEITLVRVKRGKGYIVAGYTRDLREQKAMIAAMQRTQDELRLARDIAEKSAKAKSEFLANMSHETRTPMNAILGMTYLLGKTEITNKQREYLEQAEYSANLLLRIINDILDFANLDTDNMKLEVMEFSLRKLMRHIHEIVRGEISAKSLKLFSNIDDDAEDALIGDPVRLEQVLLNLVSNAVKFTPTGGKLTVRVHQTAVLPGAVTLRFEVEDTGIGMTAEQAAGLFQPFSQGDTSSTRQYGGMGLGLAVSRRLIGIMDGELECTSTKGEGSIFGFSLTFPLAGEVARAARSLSDDVQGGEESESDLAGMRVLLAEDNEINQMIAEELLTARGIDVTIVGTGQKALDALKKSTFDLVLMDIQMPEMDGLTATKTVRADPAYAELPVIAMTAHASTEDRELSLNSGMNDHITKPITPELLYATLERWGSRNRKPKKTL